MELLIVLLVLGLLSLVVLPALANNRPRSQRVICANNLRQVGAALQLWGNEHQDLFPQEVPVAEGGTRLHPLAPNVWLHFAWLSNELGSPKVLFCPADTGHPARDFTRNPTGAHFAEHHGFHDELRHDVSFLGPDGAEDAPDLFDGVLVTGLIPGLHQDGQASPGASVAVQAGGQGNDREIGLVTAQRRPTRLQHTDDGVIDAVEFHLLAQGGAVRLSTVRALQLQSKSA